MTPNPKSLGRAGLEARGDEGPVEHRNYERLRDSRVEDFGCWVLGFRAFRVLRFRVSGL